VRVPKITTAIRVHPSADLRKLRLDANQGPITVTNRLCRMYNAINVNKNNNEARPIIFRASSREMIRTINAIAIKTISRVAIALSS
jgi:hypothetical protein